MKESPYNLGCIGKLSTESADSALYGFKKGEDIYCSTKNDLKYGIRQSSSFIVNPGEQ